MYDELHMPLLPVLRYVLPQSMPRHGLVLDLACGEGQKTPLLAETLGPGLRLIGLDLMRATSRGGPPLFVCGDAHALPFRDACLDGAVCIAAVGLFREQIVALRELRRALKPGAPVLLATAEYAWAQVIAWPAELAELLRAVLPDHTAYTTPDLGGDLAGLAADAGFGAIGVRAFRLDGAADPWLNELLPLPWPVLRPVVAGQLKPAELMLCDEVTQRAEIELVEMVVVVTARTV
jgi:SAM-dependent methyltransferase